jgi:uncharacterized alkaline shock family protein YloU
VSAEAERPTGRVDAEAEAERVAGRVAAAVAGCPGVARLAPGPIATYLPGRVVTGVAVRESSVRVGVVPRYGPSLQEVARQVRAAVREAAPGRRVDVVIEDIEMPADRQGAAAAPED